MFLFVLPAEYGLDPTGFGRATGLTKIAAEDAQVVAAVVADGGTAARSYMGTFRTDTIDIPLPVGDAGELEYKVQVKAGGTFLYSWEAEGAENPEWFYYDFHGESWPRAEGEKAKVATYEQKTGVTAAGSLIAPFEGVHGWYLQNQGRTPVVVHLKISGFYELIPPGEYGNLANIPPP